MKGKNGNRKKGFEAADIFSPSQKLALHEILVELSPRERRVVQLHYWENQSLTEIGQTMRLEWREVKALMESAYSRLRSLCLQHPAFKETNEKTMVA